MSQLDPKTALRKTLRRSSAVEIQDGRMLDSVEAAALPPAVRPRRARTLRERAFLGGMLLFIVTVFSWFFDLSGVAEGNIDQVSRPAAVLHKSQ